MTALLMEFRRVEQCFRTMLSQKSKEWLPMSASLSGSGHFVRDVGQDVSPDADTMPAEGLITLGIHFWDRDVSEGTEPPFSLTPLTERADAFEFDVYMPSSHIPWMLSMLAECDHEDRVLSCLVSTPDEVREVDIGNRTITVPGGRFFMCPSRRRIVYK